MLMPKAPMHKDHLFSGSKHNIRPTWQVGSMQPIPEAVGIEQATNN